MRLSELRSAMSEYATRFDPELVSAPDAARVVDDAAAIEKIAAIVKSLAAARVAETELWKRDGDREDWAKTHTTVFDLLDRLCTHHHDLKTTENWGLIEGYGKRAFVPPDDPRHPRNAHGPPVAA